MMEEKQAARKYQSMTQEEKEVLAENISERLIFEPREIQQAVLSLMGEVDPELVKKLEKRFYFLFALIYRGCYDKSRKESNTKEK